LTYKPGLLILQQTKRIIEKGGDMLELFKRDIPEIDKLNRLLQKMIDKKKCTLEEIKDAIYEHIAEHKKLHNKDDYKAESMAFHALDSLIDDLDVNITNYKRIKEYMSSYHSYSCFNHLIVDFQMFLTKREILHLIDHGTIIYGSDRTEHWKPIKEIVLTLLEQDKIEKFTDAYQRYKSNRKKK
jgi:hypothetical protein